MQIVETYQIMILIMLIFLTWPIVDVRDPPKMVNPAFQVKAAQPEVFCGAVNI